MQVWEGVGKCGIMCGNYLSSSPAIGVVGVARLLLPVLCLGEAAELRGEKCRRSSHSSVG